MALGRLLTKNETAGRLRVSLRTLETRFVNIGRLKPVRLTPGRVLFHEGDVDAVIAGIDAVLPEAEPKSSSALPGVPQPAKQRNS